RVKAAYDRGVKSLPATDDVDASPPTIAISKGSTAPGASREIPEIVRRRLAPEMPDDRLFSWIGTAVIVIIAGVLRFLNLSPPKGKLLDESPHPPEQPALLKQGGE